MAFISYRDTHDTAFNIPKASDRVWHTGLLRKLKSYWISCLNWIEALKLSILLNCLQENCCLDWFCEISFSWYCSLSLYLYYTILHKILFSGLGCCSQLLLACVRQAVEPGMLNCWSFTSCLFLTLASPSKYNELKSFLQYYFGRCSPELAEMVPLPHSSGRSSRYPNRLHDFLVIFLDVVVMSLPTVSFYSQLGSGILHAECFPLTYDLNIIFWFFLNSFPICFSSFPSCYSCYFMPCIGYSALHGMNPN